jgi:hypothetical protein
MPADPASCDFLRFAVRRTEGDAPGRLRQLAERVSDWDAVLDLAHEQRVSPLVHQRRPELEDLIPTEAGAKMHAAHQLNLLQNMASAVELIRLLRELESRSIPAMPFKGVVLAASAYGGLAARAAGDIDLLVHFRDLAAGTALLKEHGFELQTPVHADGSPSVPNYFEYHFERPSDGMVVELRWRLELIQPRFTRDLGMDWVWPGHVTATLAGAEVPDLRPEIALLVLCMHGCKHVWSRLIWICDVDRLLAAHPGLNWKEAIRQAKRHGLWKALALGVLLAERIAGAPVPPAVLRRFEAESGARALALHIEKNIFDAPGSTPPALLPYNVRLLGISDRVRLVLSRGFLQPNEADVAAFPLPKPLYPLYSLLRPVRILFDRSARR